MPYIAKESRPLVEPISQRIADKAGELNYQVTKLCRWYVESHGRSYSTYNELIGVLECAKLELYRRMVAPYENTKIAENGDVY